ncbi:hypothetical protein NL676_030563 [Syzygium grande]|nr:hypothetical protein NL676_030563 [Syzygium grande]
MEREKHQSPPSLCARPALERGYPIDRFDSDSPASSINPSNRVEHTQVEMRFHGGSGDWRRWRKLRFLSLALVSGFDQQSATKCLDRLVSLYRDEGREFVTVEHCGDDFFAKLAKTMQDSEDWDYLQAAESEACGILADMLGQDICNGCECNVLHGVNIIEDSPQPKENQTFLEVDYSTDSEDEGNIFGSKMEECGDNV